MLTRVVVLAALLPLAGSVLQPRSQPPPMVDSQAFLEQAQRTPTPPVAPGGDRRVADLVERMTLEEKVGQMTQLEIGMVTDGKDADLIINPQKLHKAVVEYGVGSILNVKDLALPVEKWHELISAIQKAAGETRLKIPVIYGVDTIHGANYVKGATLFPQPLGMAATWNPQLMLDASRAAAGKAGAMSVLVNSGDVNGIPGHANRRLLTDILRGELGFRGLVVSDWEDIKKMVTAHRFSSNEKDATRVAVLAGIDMSMVPSDYSFSDLLIQLVNEGTVPIARIDEAVTRVLTMKSRLGLLEVPMRGAKAPTRIGSAEARQLSLQAARE